VVPGFRYERGWVTSCRPSAVPVHTGAPAAVIDKTAYLNPRSADSADAAAKRIMDARKKASDSCTFGMKRQGIDLDWGHGQTRPGTAGPRAPYFP
jgi:hypothetical protein